MKKRRYQISPRAEADLDEHADNIARDNLKAGLRLYDLAEETYEMLAAMPNMGALYPTAKSELMGLRYSPIKEFSRYLIYYKPTESGIGIIRILHARMNKGDWL